MTPEQINIKIAEVCGWRNIRELDDLYPDGSVAAGIWWQGVDPTDSQERAILDYAGDLNAMHEAEEFLNACQCEDYEAWLMDFNASGGEPCKHYRWHATARQRAEAFLRTVGKWKEEA